MPQVSCVLQPAPTRTQGTCRHSRHGQPAPEDKAATLRAQQKASTEKVTLPPAVMLPQSCKACPPVRSLDAWRGLPPTADSTLPTHQTCRVSMRLADPDCRLDSAVQARAQRDALRAKEAALQAAKDEEAFRKARLQPKTSGASAKPKPQGYAALWSVAFPESDASSLR